MWLRQLESSWQSMGNMWTRCWISDHDFHQELKQVLLSWWVQAMYLTAVQRFTLPGKWFSCVGGFPSGWCDRGNAVAWAEVSNAIFMPGRILVGLCLPPWKDRSSVHPVSYLVTLYECLRCLTGLRWHNVSVFRQLNPYQCCNRAFKLVCPNVENKHLSSALFLSPCPLPLSNSCEEICGNNWIAE